MQSRKVNKILGIIIGISILVSVSLGLITRYGIYTYTDIPAWVFIPPAIGLIAIVVFLVYNFAVANKIKPVDDFGTPAASDAEREEAMRLYKKRVEEGLRIASEKRDETQPSEIIHAIDFTNELSKSEVCMVCKLFLKQTDEILQCPTCERLYHKGHLLDWIRSHKNCPVCAQELLVEVK